MKEAEALRVLDPKTTAAELYGLTHDEAVEKVEEACRLVVHKIRDREKLLGSQLTIDDLREMVKWCEGVYVAKVDGSPLFREQRYCAAVLDVKPAFGSSVMHIQAIYGNNLTLWEDDYGKTWVAYPYPPEAEPKKKLTPCDCCAHDPPSSFGGKPCPFCPAEARPDVEEETP